MGLGEDIALMKQQVELMSSYFDAKRAAGGKKIKIPRKVLRQVKKGLKDNKVLVPCFGSNRGFTFEVGYIDGGLVRVGDDSYEYDPKCVYTWRKNKKTLLPVYGVLKWRLTPVGSAADIYQGVLAGFGDDVAEQIATQFNIKNYGQKTIIRGIQAEEVNAEMKKKKKKPGMMLVWGAIAVIVVFYLLSKVGGGS